MAEDLTLTPHQDRTYYYEVFPSNKLELGLMVRI